MSSAHINPRRNAALFTRLAALSLAAIPLALLGAAAVSPSVQASILVTLGSLSACATGQGATTCVAGDATSVVTHGTVRAVAAGVLALVALAWTVVLRR